MFDWDAPAPLPHVIATTRAAAKSAQAESAGLAGDGTGLERIPSLEAAGGKSSVERLELLDAALTYARADDDIAAQLRRGAREMLQETPELAKAVNMRQLVGLEAVIETDGTAPSLTVSNGFVNVRALDVGDWQFALTKSEALIRKVVACVGRLNVPIAPGFAGTVFAIAPDLVVTNRHVLEAIARLAPEGQWKLEWPDETTIDFTAEFGKPIGADYKVIGVEFFGPNPINDSVNLGNLDLAILRIAPVAGAKAVGAVTLEQSPAALYHGQGIYAVGFPAPPYRWFGPGKPPPRYETVDVLNKVFDRKLGVKKLAPGRVMQLPGTMLNDSQSWAFSHACSTLAGNSGSALVDLDDNGGRVVGIHFAGISREKNYAHHFTAIHTIMAEHGAQYGQG